MYRILPLALVFLVTLPACAQPSEQSREDRIIENLKFEFEQLRQLSVEMQSIEDSGIEGLEIGTFIRTGQLRPYQQMQGYLIRKKLELLEHELEHDPPEIEETQRGCAGNFGHQYTLG